MLNNEKCFKCKGISDKDHYDYISGHTFPKSIRECKSCKEFMDYSSFCSTKSEVEKFKVIRFLNEQIKGINEFQETLKKGDKANWEKWLELENRKSGFIKVINYIKLEG